MKFYPVSSIQLPKSRQRKDYPPEHINSLAESIQGPVGLLHAIGVDEVDGVPLLRYGGCRLRAVSDIWDLGGQFTYAGQQVPEGCIPTIPTNGREEYHIRLIELEENIRRQNLTWQEEAAATAELKELRTIQAAAEGLPPPTVADIAQETLGQSHGGYASRTRRDLILAKNLNRPEVSKAKTADEAWKALKRVEEADRHARLAETVGVTFSSAAHTVLNCDSLPWMKAQPPEQFDVILTDPPYGMGADEFGDSGGRAAGGHLYEDSPEIALRCYHVLATEGFRLAKPAAHLYAFCDIDLFAELKQIFARAGWRVFRTPLVWHKPAAFRAPWPEHGPQRKYELILYCVKGNRPVARLAPDVITVPVDSNLGHSAQKPTALLEDLLRRSVRPGDRVLDPFGGTGSIIPAAHKLRCAATVLEQDPAAYGIAVARLQSLDSPQLEL